MSRLTYVLPLLAAALPASHAAAQLSMLGAGPPAIRGQLGPVSIDAATTGGVHVRVLGREVLGRSPARSRGAPSTPRAPSATPASTAGAARASRILTTADRYVGTPYTWGGTSPTKGFDCSGFVQYVFRRHGVELPRTSRQQARVGEAVSPDESALRPGDLMLFASHGTRIDHVAIYAGDGRIIHATSSGGGVRYDRLDSRRGAWFRAHHVRTRRVVANGRGLVRELDAALRAWAPLDPPDGAPAP